MVNANPTIFKSIHFSTETTHILIILIYINIGKPRPGVATSLPVLAIVATELVLVATVLLQLGQDLPTPGSL